MTRVRLFTNGHSQAVRIPKALEFEGVSEIDIQRKGDTIILRPQHKSWISFADEPSADEDFMRERPGLAVAHRVDFDD